MSFHYMRLFLVIMNLLGSEGQLHFKFQYLSALFLAVFVILVYWFVKGHNICEVPILSQQIFSFNIRSTELQSFTMCENSLLLLVAPGKEITI